MDKLKTQEAVMAVLGIVGLVAVVAYLYYENKKSQAPASAVSQAEQQLQAAGVESSTATSLVQKAGSGGGQPGSSPLPTGHSSGISTVGFIQGESAPGWIAITYSVPMGRYTGASRVVDGVVQYEVVSNGLVGGSAAGTTYWTPTSPPGPSGSNGGDLLLLPPSEAAKVYGVSDASGMPALYGDSSTFGGETEYFPFAYAVTSVKAPIIAPSAPASVETVSGWKAFDGYVEVPAFVYS